MKKSLLVKVFICTLILLSFNFSYGEFETESTEVGLDFTFETRYSKEVEKQHCLMPNALFVDTPIKLHIESDRKSSYRIKLEYVEDGIMKTEGFLYDNRNRSTSKESLWGMFKWIKRNDLYLPEIKFDDDLNMIPAKITLYDVVDPKRSVTRVVVLMNTSNWDVYTLKAKYIVSSFNSPLEIKEFKKELIIPKMNPDQDAINIARFYKFADHLGVEVTEETKSAKETISKNDFVKLAFTSAHTINQDILQKYFSNDFATLGVTTLQCANIFNGKESLFNFVNKVSDSITIVNLALNFGIYCQSLDLKGGDDYYFAYMSTVDDYVTGYSKVCDGYYEYDQKEFLSLWNDSDLESYYDENRDSLVKEEVQKQITYVLHKRPPSKVVNDAVKKLTVGAKALIDMKKDGFMLLLGKSGF